MPAINCSIFHDIPERLANFVLLFFMPGVLQCDNDIEMNDEPHDLLRQLQSEVTSPECKRI